MSTKSDTDLHYDITNNFTFEMQQTFPDKHKSVQACSSEPVYVGCRWLCKSHC